MPKVSKDSLSPVDQGGAGTEWRGEMDGYTTSFVDVTEDADLTELLRLGSYVAWTAKPSSS